jgi:hypothetical protein
MATETNAIYQIIADGRKVGIVVSNSKERAAIDAHRALCRWTVSKEQLECDYTDIAVVELRAT